MKQIVTYFTIIATAFLSLFANAQSSSYNELLKILDETTPASMKKNNVPGVAIAIIENGEVILKKAYGFSDLQTRSNIDEHTGFNIGSISKMFTAWGVMKLVEEGKIKLDDPVVNHLSTWNFPKSDFNSSKITVRSLLQHTAGLSVHGYNGFESKKELTSVRESIQGKSNPEEAVKLIMDPESKWKYSGGGYSVLQLLIEEVSGKSFAKYMDKNVFKPLKMKHTSFTINKKVLKKSAKPYNEEGKEIPLRLFNAQAAAGLHTTLEDLIIFAKASFKKNPVLSEKSIETLRSPTELSRGNYGMGYMIMNRFGNFTLEGHGGSNEGWQSGFMLDFKSKSGIIILTNGSSGRNVLFGSIQSWVKWRNK